MISNKLKSTWFILFLVALLSSCGWHLRGVGAGGDNLKGTKFYINDNNFNLFSNNLSKNLYNYKAEIVDDPKNADYVINIQDAKEGNELTSVVGGASNNTYLLSYTATYNVVKAFKDPKEDKDNEVIPNKTARAEQYWQSNSTMQLAQNNEARRVYKNIQNDVSNQVINQIQILLPNDSSKSQAKAKGTKK